jgi:serine/threonine-protein kinase PpkA
MQLKKILSLASVMLVVSQVNAAEPLKMEGKESLYQRVLTTAPCPLYANKTDTDGPLVPTFNQYYVYERDGDFVAVGNDTKGKIEGYLKTDCVIDWKMQSALMFTNPAARKRSLIFDTDQSLLNFVENDSPDQSQALLSLLEHAEKGESAPGVVSIEPATYVDWKKNFYLLPILEAQESMFADGNYTRLLHIGSVSDKATVKTNKSSDPVASELKAFKAAVVFVIDSSISMQPYIDRTRKAVSDIYDQIEKENLQDSVHFGIVSFRSDVKAVPGLEYTSKMYVAPGEANNREDLMAKLKTLNQAKVSSSLFDEDAYSGISEALDKINWNNYGGRYIVLITDAGAIEGNNKHSSTGLDAKELRAEAEHHGAAIYALHLLTASGKRNHNHDKAKAQYEELTFNKVINKSLYYPVKAGDVNAFGKRVDELAQSLTIQVMQASSGDLTAGSANSANDEQDQMLKDTELLGKAMQLAYLGSTQNTKAPTFFEGWMSDRDLFEHSSITATPVTLLNKLQLSNLKQITSQILEAANTGMLEPEAMFSQLRSIAVSLGRDPNQLSQSSTLKLSELGLLDEYLDGLPYKSLISDLDEDTWASMGADEQNQTIADLESKIQYYQKANDDTSRWLKLNSKADESEAVYPIPFDMLP